MLENEDLSAIEGQYNETLTNQERRLLGGSAANVSEELKELIKLQELEEPENAATKEPETPEKLERRVSSTPSARSIRWWEKRPKNKREKIALGIKYALIISLVLVLLFSIIVLASVKEWQHTRLQLVLQPDKVKTIPIADIDDNEKRLWVELRGPFSLSEDTSRETNEEPSATLYVTEKDNGVENRISNDFQVDFVKPEEFDNVQNVRKEKTFILDRKDGSKVFLNLQTTNVPIDVCLLLSINSSPVDQNRGIIYGTIVLIFLYFLIVTEIIDRTFASLIAAALALGFVALCNEKVDQNTIISWIDVETLVLLVGMMLLVSMLAESGIFDYFAVLAYKIAKGRVWALINCLSFFTAFLAMFLDSVTMMLLATPVTIRLCEVLSLDPVPILIFMVVFANIGAAMTPIGDPPNVIITLNPFIAKSGVNFGNFTLHMMPGVVITLLQTYGHIRILFRKPESLRFKKSKEEEDLRHQIAVWQRTAAGISPSSQEEDVARQAINEKIHRLKEKLAQLLKDGPSKEQLSFEETLAHLTKQYPLKDKPLLIKASIAFFFVLFFFFTHSVPGMVHVSLGWSALIGALLLLVISDRRDLEALLCRIEWSTLLFFAALFIVMECLAMLGVIDLIGKFVVDIISAVNERYQLALAIFLVVWVSGIASAFLDNIPVTTMMVKIIIRLAEDSSLNLPLHPLVWSLAFGACFGGNGTLIGASANVVTAGVSEQHGYKITFVRFFLVCFPIMLGNLVCATTYLIIATVACKWYG